MADNSLKINVEVGAGLQKASKEFKDLQTRVKELDYEFRKQKISADGLKAGLADVDLKAKALNLTYKQNIDLSAQIFQVNQRAINSFKSMSGSFRDLQQAQHAQTQASNRSQQGFVALAYIIQDLPYGIRGVANNITQLSQVLGTPIWLNLAISGFTSLAVVFSNMKKNTEEATEAMKDMMDTVKLFAKYGMSFDMAGNLDLARNTIKAKMQGLGQEFGVSDEMGNVVSTYYKPRPENQSEYNRLEKELKALDDYAQKNKDVLDIERERANVHGLINYYTGGALDKLIKMEEKTKKGMGDTRWTGEYQFGSKFGDVGGLTGGEGLSPFQRSFMYGGWKSGKGAAFQKETSASDWLSDKDAKEKHALAMRENAFENNLKREQDALREAMQVANSVFFNPMRGAFESIITGSANMADAFEKAIKQMIASLIANAALSGILALLFPSIGFGKIFMGMSGLGSGRGGGGNDDDENSVIQRATGNIVQRSGGMIPIQIVGESRLQGDVILTTYRNANSRDIRRNA